MWLFTPIGFFSVVKNKYCQNDELMVRSREKKDLMLLGRLVRIGTILETPHADYQFRAIVKASALAGAMAEMIRRINYSNFKDFVHSVDVPRAIAYGGVWAAAREAYAGQWYHEKKEAEPEPGPEAPTKH